MQRIKKVNRRDLIIKVFIVLTVIYLMKKYVFENWDNIKNFIANLF